MKFTVFAFVCLVSLTANCALYGWLESSVNMIEGLRLLFAPGAGTVVFSPFLLLFILVGLSGFVTVPVCAVAIVAMLSAYPLRSRAITVSRSFARTFVLVAVVCQFAFLLCAIQRDAPFLRDRPRVRPKSPAIVLASLAAANAGLNLLIAAVIVRKMTASAGASNR
jgi:hypothetical protein